MKKALAILLALVLVFSAALPAFAGDRNAWLDGETSLAKIGKLTVSTGGKAKQLVLQWSAVPRADGYQILRSTTGKTGSYKAIADESATTYIDTGLKHSRAYYYAVRAYAWTGSRTIYSPYKKANLSTRITKSYACNRFRQTWKVMDKIWSSVKHPENYLENADLDAVYYPITFKGYTTKAQLKNYLNGYFTKKTADAIVNQNFTEIGGKLYAVAYMVLEPQNGLQSSERLLLNDVSLKKMKYADKKTTFTAVMPYLIVTGPGPFDDEYRTDSEKLTLSYESGRWVFSQSKWNFWWDWSFRYAV